MTRKVSYAPLIREKDRRSTERGRKKLHLSPSSTVRRSHDMRFGARLISENCADFRLWAPSETQVGLQIGGADPLPMNADGDGWHELIMPNVGSGARYQYVLGNGTRIPDPASRYQPDDVHGPSELIDPLAYQWRDGAWRGRPWHECVLYECHVGTFTAEGTFDAVTKKLTHLVELGVTAIELMPIADFPGARNWGYDGVLSYAPDSSYGRPEQLKNLIDTAHSLGLMVFLDVVYNHFGPEGNYLPACAPNVFTERHQTPWGAAINYDSAQSACMREFVAHNALYWIEEFHFDGLRLDAVHAIVDESPTHLLFEIAQRVMASAPERHIHLVVENEENDPALLRRAGEDAPSYRAQWNDDVHHALHTAATRESAGYYGDYVGDTVRLARALAEGFAFQGERMPFRNAPRGAPSAHLPPLAFVSFIQNHDQIGNRAFGERIGQLAASDVVRAVASIYLLLPQIPMLFMGEEWNASQPFYFFCDFGGELAGAVREGRRAEFSRFPQFADPLEREKIPDPVDAHSFESTKLNWADLANPEHAEWLEWYREILSVRSRELVPRLTQISSGGQWEVLAPQAVRAVWAMKGASLVLNANLSPAPVVVGDDGRTIWQHRVQLDGKLAPFSVRWSISDDSKERSLP